MSAAAVCGCCTGVAARTPLEVANRPGLSAVAYRTGVHGDFLASMVAGLSRSDRPRLAELGTRDSDDFTLALLDAWAVAADVLSFYSERLAQETYLRTARDRGSLQELGRLLGYRLRPGVAAEAHLAFALEPPPEVPAAASRDPGSAPPVTPPVVTLEPGLRVQSIPGPGERPQTFETVEEVEARPEWNAIPALQSRPQTFALGDKHAYLVGGGLNLKPGDLLLLVGADIPGEKWDVRTLTKVLPEPERDRTRVEWVEGLGSALWNVAPAAAPQAFVLRKRIGVFGHNAPLESLLAPGEGDWEFVLSTGSGQAVDLDGAHPDVVADSYAVLAKPNYRELFQVDDVAELSRADYAVSGKVTRITLKGGENFALFAGAVRETTVFAVSEPLTLAEAPEETDVTGDTLDVRVDVSAMAAGRRLLVRGRTTAGEEHAEAVAVEEVQAVSGAWRIMLAADLAQDYERASLVVHGNVALATHGETVQQLLGSGRASLPFQRFGLAHEPLTHLQSTAEPSGAEAALEVRVNDVRWEEVPTLYGAGPRDRAYALRTDEAGRPYVQFGDGERGARLPSGVNNVRARYRKGLGAAGNVGAGALAQLLDRPLGVKGVANPAPASGGVDPEAEEAARGSIPLGARTLGRAVSLLDYEDFARAFGGVVKAQAAELALRAGPAVVVTAAFAGGDRLDDLEDALRRHGDPRVDVVVLAATTTAFRLALRVAVDPAHEEDAVLAGVEAALREEYSFDARGLGEPVFASRILAAAHRVAGVLAVDLDRLYTGTAPALHDRLLAQRPAVGPGGTALAAGLLELASGPFDWLEALP